MRVFIAGLFGDHNGIETYTRILAKSLVRAGHTVSVVARAEKLPDRLEGVDLHRLAPRARVARRVLGPLESLRASSSIARRVAAWRADVVHATYPELAPRSSTPLVVTLFQAGGPVARARTARSRRRGPLREAAYGWSDGVAIRRASRVIATTPAVGRAVADRGFPTDVVWPFVEDDEIRSPGPRSSDCVMVAGHLDDPMKGLDLAVEAVRLLRRNGARLKLILIGGWRRGTPPSLPDFCEATGPMPRPELLARLATAGVCVLPSRFEEFGYAALEALASGVPVVCSADLAIADLPTDGIVASARRDGGTFAAAIDEALSLPGVHFPQECRASVAASRIESIYRAAIARRTE